MNKYVVMFKPLHVSINKKQADDYDKEKGFPPLRDYPLLEGLDFIEGYHTPITIIVEAETPEQAEQIADYLVFNDEKLGKFNDYEGSCDVVAVIQSLI